jgi:hypothetical protein
VWEIMSRGWGPRGGSLPLDLRSGPFTAGRVPVGPISRGSVSLLFALSKDELIAWRARRRRRGFEGWGRHLRGGPATAAKQHVALTHPSNLREIRARIIRASSTRSHVHEGGNRGTRRPNALGREHAAIAQQRIEDAGEAPGEGDDSDL